MGPPITTAAPGSNAWQIIDASRRFHRRLDTRLDDSLEELGISYAQFEILELLTRDRNAHAAALARRLQVSRQIASRLLAKLARAGLVDLLPPDGGVRVPLVTRDGRRRIQLAVDAIAPIRRQLLSVAPERRANFVELADDLNAVLRPPGRSWWLD